MQCLSDIIFIFFSCAHKERWCLVGNRKVETSTVTNKFDSQPWKKLELM